MLFNKYNSALITKDMRVIRTGRWYGNRGEDTILDNVTIEETDDEIKVHGYRRVYDYFGTVWSEEELEVSGLRNVDEYCTTEEDFYHKEYSRYEFRGFMLKKVEYKKKYLSSGWYYKKRRREVCYSFHKIRIIEEYRK